MQRQNIVQRPNDPYIYLFVRVNGTATILRTNR